MPDVDSADLPENAPEMIKLLWNDLQIREVAFRSISEKFVDRHVRLASVKAHQRRLEWLKRREENDAANDNEFSQLLQTLKDSYHDRISQLDEETKQNEKELIKMFSNTTVVELDLVGYSGIVRLLEQNSDADAVHRLNEQIQKFVDEGVRAVDKNRADVVATTTGDGAILLFDTPEQAHRFAEQLHATTAEHNATREASATRHFRVGAATGEIAKESRPNGGFEIAGITIANAVRLEAQCSPGQLLVDIPTFDRLPLELKRFYQDVQEVPGKHGELFKARATNFRLPEDKATVPSKDETKPEPTEAAAPKTPAQKKNLVREILVLSKQLNPKEQLDTLAALLGMPVGSTPPDTIGWDRRFDKILEHMRAQPKGLEEMVEELRWLIKNQD